MGAFMGGSAYNMANQVAEGYVLVTERTFTRFSRGDLDKLAFEMEKLQREVRAEQPAIDDTKAVQQRNRKLMRIKGALMMLRSYRMRRKT